ncbi:MAG: peptidoglycan-binding protein [Defluviitaleaceae bacterium]|nr:peptidoglycan-binding protein [Defluviitaleaceae bacterium]
MWNEEMTIKELRKYAEDNGVSLGNLTIKKDIIDAIRQAEMKEQEAIGEINELTTQKTVETPENKNDTENDTFVIPRLLQVSRLLMTGKDVSATHNALIEKGLHCGKESEQGIYGKNTAYAVRVFQAKKGLIVDGKVGKFTAKALGFEWGGK